MDLSKYHFSNGIHRSQHVIWIKFPCENILINELRSKFPLSKWSQSNKMWYLPDIPAIRKQLNLPEKISNKRVANNIHPNNLDAFKSYYRQLKLKSYSSSTINTYTDEFAQLLILLGAFPVQNLTVEKLKSYFLYCVEKQKLSEAHLNSRINAVKFYFEKVLMRPRFFFEIPRPKKPLQLPKVLNKTEILKILDVTTNLKHIVILKLCYGMGLRVSEIVRLKVSHIDSKRMQVLIQSAKGKKDRYVPLPASVLKDLRKYYKQYKPKEYLFEGQFGGHYSVRSIQAVFKAAMKKAKVRKQIGIHGLRHSYATHLLESGTDISFIQKLLGHNNIKTTLTYTRVSNAVLSKVKSPLDNL